MRYFKLENLKVSEFTTSPKIYALQIRTEDRTKYVVINYSSYYPYKDWSIAEAIADYISPKGEEERFESWYRAYCD